MPQVASEYFQRNRSVLYAFHERGAVAYLDLIGFPIYLPSVMPAHLAARSDSFGFYQDRQGELLRPGLSQWSIGFVSRTEDGPTDLLSIQFLDSTYRDYAVMSAQSPWWVMQRLAQVAREFNATLWEEGGVHAVVNDQAVKDAPISHHRIPFASGEVAEWEFVHLAPATPLCHAFAQVGETDISVAAAGQVAADLIPLIASMERVTPTSPQLSRITEELRTAQLARYANPRSSQ